MTDEECEKKKSAKNNSTLEGLSNLVNAGVFRQNEQRRLGQLIWRGCHYLTSKGEDYFLYNV